MNGLFQGITLVAVLGIFGGIIKFAYEVARDNTRRRGEVYDKLREKFDSDEFEPIYCLLETYAYGSDNEQKEAEKAIRALSVDERQRFGAFIEHVALVAKSGVINYALANYEFGYYTRLCWKCPPFWDDLCDENGQNDPYWAIYREFVDELEPFDRALREKRESFLPKKTLSKIKI